MTSIMRDLVDLNLFHRLWRILPARPRRSAFSRGTALLAPRPDRDPPPVHTGIAIVGELSRASGLGEGARLMIAGLEQLRVPCWPVDVSACFPGNSAGMRAVSPPAVPRGVPLVIHVNPPMLARALLHLPRALVRGRRIVGHWAWELPIADPSWRIGAGFVHEVWAPSRFTAEALQPLTQERVRVVPYPVTAVPSMISVPARAHFGLPDGAVVVLVSFNLASSFERKNPLGAIAAFRLAFGGRMDRLLVVKVINTGHFPEDFARLLAAAGAPNIRLMTEHLSFEATQTLSASVDIVMSLHRSEGFGLVPAEAMLLGKPVIATGWSGNMDFMDDRCAALTGYRLVPASDPRGVFQVPGAVWAEPDVADAAAHLRRLADDPAARRELGERARAAATERLGTAGLADALRAWGLLSVSSPVAKQPVVAT
jgi:glycosyltransferase involved in cell wall biosynthesis